MCRNHLPCSLWQRSGLLLSSSVRWNFGFLRSIDCRVHERHALGRFNQVRTSLDLQPLAHSFSVRSNVQVPATARHIEDQPKCQAHTPCRGLVLGLAEDLDDVSVSQALPQLQQVVSYSFSCRLDQTGHLQKLLVRRSSSNPAQHWVARLACNTFLSKSFQHTFYLHVIVRQIHIGTHWRVAGQITGFRQSQFICTNEPSISSSRVPKTLGSR